MKIGFFKGFKKAAIVVGAVAAAAMARPLHCRDSYSGADSNIDHDAICGSTYGTSNNGQDWHDMFGMVVKNNTLLNQDF